MKICDIFIKCILILFLTSSACYADSVYWYIDDDGVTHFSSEPVDGGNTSGQIEYNEIKDDSIVTNPNGTTTTVVNSSQFTEGTFNHPNTDTDSNDQIVKRSGENGEKETTVDDIVRQESIVKDKSQVINLSNRPMYEDDFD